MTEKIESIEMYPMRGHSRGEWYATLKDIVDTEEDAEYWALFGVTHRGNKHCLGEFPTKIAAETAINGMSLFRKVKKASSGTRTIVQIEVVHDPDDPTTVGLFALCDDGTVWRRGIGIRSDAASQQGHWERISLDGIGGNKT